MAMNKKLRRWRKRIVIALVLFAMIFALTELLPLSNWLGGERNAVYAEFALYLIPYAIAGYDVLLKAARNIKNGQLFDENFLMAVATIGAFSLVFFPDSGPHMAEGAAVMLFYQVGELFQQYAVGKSRKSIAAMMDIAPDFANVRNTNGDLEQVDPDSVAVGSEIVVKPGERVPIDGVVVEGSSQLDTAALTGESVPRAIEAGSEVVSGCVNLTGLLVIKTTKPFGESTVSRILELVENAAEKKAHTENFITRFARYYTPAVCGVALVLALLPPLLDFGALSDWVFRGLTFLVVSCPCALVISVPLSFFGGIGGASKLGILIKGSNYLESLASVDTVVFDKTGTLTSGTFGVVAVHPAEGVKSDRLLELAAHAEAYSDHPIAMSVKQAYGARIDETRVSNASEVSGRGVQAKIDGASVSVGNDKLMASLDIDAHNCELVGTMLHVAEDGKYLGHIVIADMVKEDAAKTIADLHATGVTKTVMLTGDAEEVARSVASKLGLDEFHAKLLPQDKVAEVERLLDEESKKGRLAFVGDGINDAPVLSRADIGIAMGALGSDAAIEAADIVLMDDDPAKIALAMSIARRTLRIVYENIVFALAIKFACLVLGALGLASMWTAIFADVGVMVLAVLNATRALYTKDLARKNER